MSKNSFGAAARLRVGANDYEYYRLASLEELQEVIGKSKGQLVYNHFRENQ